MKNCENWGEPEQYFDARMGVKCVYHDIHFVVLYLSYQFITLRLFSRFKWVYLWDWRIPTCFSFPFSLVISLHRKKHANKRLHGGRDKLTAFHCGKWTQITDRAYWMKFLLSETKKKMKNGKLLFVVFCTCFDCQSSYITYMCFASDFTDSLLRFRIRNVPWLCFLFNIRLPFERSTTNWRGRIKKT